MMAGDMAGARWSGEVPALDVYKSGRAPLSKIRVRSFLFRTSPPKNPGAELFAFAWILPLIGQNSQRNDTPR
ncbi:hypothetical protein TNCV_3160901 [Trichonephila clavipes]|nr:hypothetical protein TNCV_3160901 [Trichonephila clavipes]